MNPQGHFKATLYNEAIRYGDRDYKAAIQRGELDHLLLDVGIQEERRTENLLFDEWLTFLFYRSGWSGCPTPPHTFGYSKGSGAASHWAIYLSYYDTGSEPNYNDSGSPASRYVSYTSFANTCGTGCFRRFVNDAVEQETWTDTSGRQQIFHRERWFFYPHDVTSNNNNIRSVWIMFADAGDSNGGYDTEKRYIGRVRFKDNNGDFVRIHKTNYQAMGLEYTFSFLTV